MSDMSDMRDMSDMSGLSGLPAVRQALCGDKGSTTRNQPAQKDSYPPPASLFSANVGFGLVRLVRERTQ